jgi:hypothetical protein
MNVDMFGKSGSNLGAFQPSTVTPRFPLTVADTSTVTALNYRGATPPHFPIVAHDVSLVSSLGFHSTSALHFPLTVSDTSTVSLGFHVNRHFALTCADTSTVVLGYRITTHFGLTIQDTSTVTKLGWSLFTKSFALRVASVSIVHALAFQNNQFTPPLVNRVVPQYSGGTQVGGIAVNPDIAYRESQREEGPWAVPPYSQIYPPDSQTLEETAVVPPPISKTDLWAAMQEWPL